MIKNYFKIAWRNLTRQPVYSIINITGLALGIGLGLVILLFVITELSYDQHFDHKDRIYRISTSFMGLGEFANGPEILVDVLREEHPEVEYATRIYPSRGPLPINFDNKQFRETGAFYIDSSFFKIFSYRLIKGKTDLNQGELILTESLSKKYFNNADPLGKIIEVGKEKVPHQVAGVIEDPDPHAHFIPMILMPIRSQLQGKDSWMSAAFYNYVLLREGVNREDFEYRVNELIREHVFPSLSQGITFEQWQKSSTSYRLIVQPLNDIYFHSKLRFELSPGGNINTVYIFSAISVFILIVAGINFINLTTARAARRAKEVGIRKTLGTTRLNLVGQFLFESILVSLLSMILAFGFAELFLMAFKDITGQFLLESIFNDIFYVLLIFGISLAIGFISGIYPAFYLTSFNPVISLGSNVKKKGFRNFLVVFQFSIAVILISSSIIIYQQLEFMRNKDMGLQRDNIIVIRNLNFLGESNERFFNQVKSHSSVENASLAYRVPAGTSVQISTYRTPQMENSVSLNTFTGDHKFIPTLGIEILNGRNFSSRYATDSSSVIINEAAAKEFNLESPLESSLLHGKKEFKIIGVVKDFNFESLEKLVEPVVMRLSSSGGFLVVKLSGSSSEFINYANSRWQELVPDEPFNYYFLDDSFAAYLEKEEILSKVIFYFTGFTIFISCLGLFGLAAYTTEQRTKEIGIRKVLGASVKSIVLLLSRNFSGLILLSLLISFPVSFWLLNKWLQNFAYKVDLNVWVFIISGIAALVVAWVTVSYQSIKAALTDPVNILRDE